MELKIAIYIIIALAVGLIIYILKNKAEEFNNESERIITDNTNKDRLPLGRGLGSSRYLVFGLLFFWFVSHSISILGAHHVFLELLSSPVDGLLYSIYVLLIRIFGGVIESPIRYTPSSFILCVGCLVSLPLVVKILQGFTFRKSNYSLTAVIVLSAAYSLCIFVLAHNIKPIFTYPELDSLLSINIYFKGLNLPNSDGSITPLVNKFSGYGIIIVVGLLFIINFFKKNK